MKLKNEHDRGWWWWQWWWWWATIIALQCLKPLWWWRLREVCLWSILNDEDDNEWSWCFIWHHRSLAKSWFTLAGWSYRKGRKAVDSVLAASSESKEETISKTQREADRQTFLALLPTSWMTQEEIESALKILDQVDTKCKWMVVQMIKWMRK